jgi:hypothetical protein
MEANVLRRQNDAVSAVRNHNPLSRDEKVAEQEWESFLAAGLTESESNELKSGPTAYDHAQTIGLVTAFASQPVKDEFLVLIACGHEIGATSFRYRSALMHQPSSVGKNGDLDVVAEAARQVIRSASEMFDASTALLEGRKRYEEIATRTIELARRELDRIRDDPPEV